MKKLFALALVVALSACATPPPPKPLTVHQRIEVACTDAGTAYAVITEVNNVHPLKASQQAQVLKAVEIIDKRCKLGPGEDYPYTLESALLSELERAADTLATIKKEVK